MLDDNLGEGAEGFTVDGLVAHLREYRENRSIEEVDLQTRYLLKEVGTHYIVNYMKLSDEEKTELKRKLSERICLEQALTTQQIPSRYLHPILVNLPPELKENDLVQQHLFLAEAASNVSESSDFPSPYGLEEQGPYTAVRQEGIRAIVQGCMQLTNEPLTQIINTPQRIAAFNQGGEALLKYLDQHPTNMGASLN